MKNLIIFELRRIRDMHAKKCNYDFDTMALDWMNLVRWEKSKVVKLQGRRIVPAFPHRKLQCRAPNAKTMQVAQEHSLDGETPSIYRHSLGDGPSQSSYDSTEQRC